MDLRQEIAQRIDALAADQQAEVLQFIASLASRTVNGESGLNLRRFARSLDSDSAQEMIQAIDEGCEQVEAGGW
jgi:hypothetical protein